MHPVFFGSAITGAGVDALIAGITRAAARRRGRRDGPVSGTVFKVERGPAGEKIAYVRMFSGTLRARDRLRFGDGDGEREGHRDQRLRPRPAVRRERRRRRARSASSGASADVRIGDAHRRPADAAPTSAHFAPPTLETVVAPARPADQGALHGALTQLAEQDPLINLRQDDVRQEISVSLYGEVQKEVIQATLADEFGIEVGFRETTTICIERPVGDGRGRRDHRARTPNPFLATVGLRVEPAPVGAGVHVPARGRARLDAVRVLQGGRGDRAGDAAARASTAGRSPTAR